MVPQEFVGAVMELAQRKRGDFVTMDYIDDNRVNVIYQSHLLKSSLTSLTSSSPLLVAMLALTTKFLVSLVKLVKMDILLNGDKVDALSFIVPRNLPYERGKLIVDKLKKSFLVNSLRYHSSSYRTENRGSDGHQRPCVRMSWPKCYGGDVSRKRKLLEKQKPVKTDESYRISRSPHKKPSSVS